jgi:hypothetical protein
LAAVQESRVPKYFFNTADGTCLRDFDGDELPDARSAGRMALAVMSEILPSHVEDMLPEGEFSVTVVDEQRRILMTVRTILSHASDGVP